MFHTFYKLILITTINLIVCSQTNAKVIERKDIHFPIEAQGLMKGDIHYHFLILNPKELNSTVPEIAELDSLSLKKEKDVKMVVSKAVSIISKPVGFFDDKQMMDENFVSHISGDQKVQKTGPESFKITVPGERGFTYNMQSFFDADDVSTLPNSKVIRAVTAAKKLDVISQGASSIIFTEKTKFTRFAKGAVSVSSFIPMKENKTLVITYNLIAVHNDVSEKMLKENFIEEIKAVKKLMGNYKE